MSEPKDRSAPRGEVKVEAGYGPKKKCYQCGEEHKRWARRNPITLKGEWPIMTKLPTGLWICRRCKMQSVVVGQFRTSVKKEAKRIRDEQE